MRFIITTVLLFSVNLLLFSQNGLKEGNYFLLKRTDKCITVNELHHGKISTIKRLPIHENIIATTDQLNRVALIDTLGRTLEIHGINHGEIYKCKLPMKVYPRCILLTSENLFIGGKLEHEMLLQFHIPTKKWHVLEIPDELKLNDKAIDDLVLSDSFLVAVDNFIYPKFNLYYRYNLEGKLALSHIRKLKSNGTYEHITNARYDHNYLALISTTYSTYVSHSMYLTVYEDLDLNESFSFSVSCLHEKHEIIKKIVDALLIKNVLIFATNDGKIACLKIEEKYFVFDEQTNYPTFNTRPEIVDVIYQQFTTDKIVKLTAIPNSEQFVVTNMSKNGKFDFHLSSVPH